MADLSVADALALGDRKDSGMFGENGIWIILLFLFFGFGGSGFGFGGNQGVASALTQNDLQRGFDTNTIVNKLDGISNGICDSSFALNNSIKDNGYATQNAITNLGYEVQQCCCNTNRNIDAVRYENAKNTCDIVTNANMNTRDIIESNTANTRIILDKINTYEMQTLRDQLSQAQGIISNATQSQYILGQLGRYGTYASAYPNCCGCSL